MRDFLRWMLHWFSSIPLGVGVIPTNSGIIYFPEDEGTIHEG